METKPELFAYGILDESSDIRAHVGVASKSIYVFRTRDAQRLLQNSNGKYRKADAYQAGVTGLTAEGFLVPWQDIPEMRALRFGSYDWSVFCPTDTTTAKGEKAVEVVKCCLRMGRFPLFADGKESENTTLQIKGTDILLYHKTRIQVKCDWYAGDGPNCTGNLFLQCAERNPLKRI